MKSDMEIPRKEKREAAPIKRTYICDKRNIKGCTNKHDAYSESVL